jgi:hypothetical protein
MYFPQSPREQDVFPTKTKRARCISHSFFPVIITIISLKRSGGELTPKYLYSVQKNELKTLSEARTAPRLVKHNGSVFGTYYDFTPLVAITSRPKELVMVRSAYQEVGQALC